jgi:hypothetical protein
METVIARLALMPDLDEAVRARAISWAKRYTNLQK